MHEEHVDPVEFARGCCEYGNLFGQKAFEAHLHQVGQCPGCVEELLTFFELESFGELAMLEEPGRELTRRAQYREMDSLLQAFARLPNEEKFERVCNDGRFHTATMAKAFLRNCRSRWGSEPREAMFDACLALVAAIRVRPTDEDAPLGGRAAMKALAYAHQGNVWRLLFDLPAAEKALGQAQAELADELCDQRVTAQVLRYQSGLLRAQRRFSWAMAAIDKAIRVYGKVSDRQGEGEALLVSARLRAAAGQSEDALLELERAEPLLERVENQRIGFVYSNLEVGILGHLGRYSEAAELLPEAMALAEETGNPNDPLRIRWCEARVTAGLGDLHEAETLYETVRSGFLELDAAFDVALVSLEIAQLYVEQERHEEVQHLACEMIPIFQSREIHRETLAAVKLFADAVRVEEEEQAETIGKLSAYLSNARHDPAYRFSL